jgi:hypothetical protein
MKHRSLLPGLSAVIALTGALGCAKPAQNAAAPASFATPDEATAALVAAVEKNDAAGLQALFGPGSANLVSSGDSVEDAKEREAFLKRYRAYHELVAGSPNDLVLLVGEDHWPMPIPLVRKAARWSFDGPAGIEELILRRIGGNELHTIDVMQGYVAAQNDYAAAGHDGAKPGTYAEKLRSSPGKHDGLYWEVAAGEPQSPAGPLLAAATSEGYGNTQVSRTPYHGYLYKLLTAQGPAANGGARDYLANGKLTGGFAVLAYPDSYGASGVMTFMVNQDGVVWQRDLGKDTAQTVAAIQKFDPDDKWTPIAQEQ